MPTHQLFGPAAGVLSGLLALLPLHSGTAAPQPGAPGAAPVDYIRDIRPILSDNCFSCHGPDEQSRKAGLRLDERESALRPAKSGDRALVPGDPKASTLLARVMSADPDEVMPPPKTKKTLSPAQVELLRRWVAEGAEYRGHWAFEKPRRPALPDSGAARHPVDAFLQERLRQEGLAFSPEADKTTLIRRVTLDLTGLPPTPAEVDAFLADRSPEAYDKVVARLLQSPRYGEHMARYWLDSARYADSHGFHIDSERSVWKYRDWVVEAFNRNMPFDQFTVEQLAGDLLPGATPEQKVGSGYVRCNMSTGEGGAIEEEYRAKYAFDRVETTGTMWMGLTLTCARCHTHKYDPITHKEYYGLYAFFNNLSESVMDGNRPNPEPFLRVPSPQQTNRLAELKALLADGQKRIEGPMEELDRSQATWQERWRERLSRGWSVPATVAARSLVTNGATLRVLEDKSILAEGGNPESDSYLVRLKPAAGQVAALRLETVPDKNLPGRGAARAQDGRFRLSEFEVEFVEDTRGTNAKPRKLKFARVLSDAAEAGFEVEKATDGKADTGWGVAADAVTQPHLALFVLAEPVQAGAHSELRVTLRHEASKSMRSLGRFRLAAAQNERLVDWLNPPKLASWQVLGPFATEGLQHGFTNVYAPEKGVDLKKSYDGLKKEIKWAAKPEFDAQDKAHQLVQDLHGLHGAYYLHRTLTVPAARKMDLALRADDAFKFWVNGKLVAQRPEDKPGEGLLRVTVDLKKGDNTLLFKVVTVQGAALFTFQSSLGGSDYLSSEVAAILATARQLSDAQRVQVRNFYRRENSPEFRRLFDEVARMREEETSIDKAIPTTMVAKESDKMRDTFMLVRGEYDKKGEKVRAGVPAILPPLPEGAPTNRLGLAQWLVAPDHPLTARVTVNRFWQQYFGVGLVKTAEDFGVQGEPPSHPALLDWLATEFVRTGWDIQRLQRLLVTSAAYRQSSRTTAALQARDPENRLLARGPRFRVDGEVLRDSALFISGLLVEQRGGRPVKPYEPAGLWEAVSFNNNQKYVQDKGEGNYRRSLYTFWKRQSPPPNMLIFDAPTREYCIVRRPRTNTPLQALVLMNDPQFVEAARAFADRILRDGGRTVSSRLAFAFRQATGRAPVADEAAALESLLRQELAAFKSSAEAARKLGGVGAFQPASGASAEELAAWTAVASVLLNLDETVTKG
ncbi:MAG: hypothetical protein RJA22_2241 [Verrucomicrobiota bacterium]